MFTKQLYYESCFMWGGEVDYFEIFRCVLLTPVTLVLDIITSPFQVIALTIGKITENKNRRK
ncbi:MAG: hypothetical protein HFJ48_03810 [Clostridia bacterium]|nr:hypothetical protein [Clostridia bacterium]